MRKKKKLLFIFASVLICFITIFSVIMAVPRKNKTALAFVESGELSMSADADNTGSYSIFGIDEDFDYYALTCATKERAENMKNQIQKKSKLDTSIWTRIKDSTIDFENKGAVLIVKVVPLTNEIKNYKIMINPLAKQGEHVVVCTLKRSQDFENGFAINDFGTMKQNRYELETAYMVSVDSGYGFFIEVYGENLLYTEKNKIGIEVGNNSENPICSDSQEVAPALKENMAKGKHYLEAKIYSVELDDEGKGIAGTERIEFTIVLKVEIQKGEASLVPTISETGNNGTQAYNLSKGDIFGIIIASVLGVFTLLYIFGYVFLYRKGKLDGHRISVIYHFLPKHN